MRLTKYQYKRLQADIGGLTTLYAIIKAEKHKEKEPNPRVRFRFLLGLVDKNATLFILVLIFCGYAYIAKKEKNTYCCPTKGVPIAIGVSFQIGYIINKIRLPKSFTSRLLYVRY